MNKVILGCLSGGIALMSACNSPLPESDTRSQGSSATAVDRCAVSTDPEYQAMPTTEHIFGWIESLVGLGRRITGTPAGYAAAAFVKCEFEKIGLTDVHYETVTSWLWEVDSSSVTVAGTEVDAYPSRFSFVTPDQPAEFSTGPEGLSTELVDVNLATPLDMQLADVAGKVVLFDLKFLLPTAGLGALTEFFWDPQLTVVEPSLLVANPYLSSYSEAIGAAMDAGAVGFIGVLADYFDSNHYNNEFYRRTNVTIPGYWVSPSEGERIRELISDSGGSAPVTLKMEGRRKEVEARSVVGFLEGQTKDTIMIQSHHDSVTPGAVEDGSGTASVLAQAQYFAKQPTQARQKTLMFTTFDTHFTGYQAHQAFINKYVVEKATPYNIVANVTLEHVAKQAITGADGELVVTELPEIRGVLNSLGPLLKATMATAIIEQDLQRTFILSGHALCSTVGMPTDASWACLHGVPTASFIAGPSYLYDDADTLDKVAVDDLVPVMHVFADLVTAIDATPNALIGLPLPHLGPQLGVR